MKLKKTTRNSVQAWEGEVKQGQLREMWLLLALGAHHYLSPGQCPTAALTQSPGRNLNEGKSAELSTWLHRDPHLPEVLCPLPPTAVPLGFSADVKNLSTLPNQPICLISSTFLLSPTLAFILKEARIFLVQPHIAAENFHF